MDGREGVCVSPSFPYSVFSYGPEIDGTAFNTQLLDLIRARITSSNIQGLLGIAVAGSGVTTGGGGTGVVVPEVPEPTQAPVDGEVDTNRTVVGVQGPGGEPIESDDPNYGLIVGATAGALFVSLLALLLFRRKSEQRNESEATRALKHRQFTEDEDDMHSGRGDTEDGMSKPPIARVINDSDDGTIETSYVSSNRSGQRPVALPVPFDKDEIHALSLAEIEAHECSSPNCEICEAKRQRGAIHFVRASVDSLNGAVRSLPSRQYVSNDTVEL